MRALVVTTSGFGHIAPVLPLASALRKAGHEVHWATHQDARGPIESAGFLFEPVGIGLVERGKLLPEIVPRLLDIPPHQRRPVMWSALFAQLEAPAKLQDLSTLVDQIRPSVIIHEPCELASAPVADRRGIPHITVGFGGAIPESAINEASEAISRIWESIGLPPPVDAGLYEFLYLHPFPKSFGARPQGQSILDINPISEEKLDPPPRWCTEVGVDRPLVYVTFGTEQGSAAPWRSILDGLAALPIDAVCTVGRSVTREMLGFVPENVRVEQFVPQFHVVSRSSVVVSHGGAGTVLGAGAEGIPQIAIPLAADQFDNADAIERSGSGLTLDAMTLTSEILASTINNVMGTLAFKSAADQVASEIAAMPRASERVQNVEELAGIL